MSAPALSVEGVGVAYGARPVLEGVSLALARGRVHALVGENGAGKTTLIRVASGLLAASRGTVRAGDGALPPGDARAAIAAGIGVVHQHFMLVPTLSVADNVALGVEPRRGPLGLLVDRERVRREVASLAEAHGLPVSPEASVDDLSVGERQRVEILKVLYRGAKVLLLDEPTAVLSPGEVRALLESIRALARQGAAVLFVSHKLDEVFSVADEVTVLRRGRVMLHRATEETTRAEVAAAVVGSDAAREALARAKGSAEGEREAPPALRLVDVRAPGLAGVTLSVRAGEVVGVAGVEGNGQRALAEVIAGTVALERGEVALGGRSVHGEGVAARRAAGLGWVPEDREGRGLLGELTVAENVALGDPAVVTEGGRFDRAAAEARARELIARFGVRPEEPWARVRDLSGGNQQKVLLGRELLRPLKALVVAQPTRGVDLGASEALHRAILEARGAGVGVLLVSSDLDELRALSDRVVVLRRGALVGEVPVAEATDARLGPWMVGAD